jgi:hypothetical protein
MKIDKVHMYEDSKLVYDDVFIDRRAEIHDYQHIPTKIVDK